ncbi:MAG: glutamine--fructose-6-phosphate transaminase (isomerizing) [Candidatus Micrarchaeia archaeon]|jgi:glucosamine--fructose-6-phosphate aminotransferase (isomerizing)
MCGIVGYIGDKAGNRIVLEGIKRLEYRGYDSVGACYWKKDGLIIKKDVGKIEEVHKKLNFLEPKSNLIIMHNRWATHGGVTKENAHPHIDCKGEIAIVHNGIIENYAKIKKFLKKKKHIFRSQTDTEVVAHLIEEFNKRSSFENACKKAFSKLKGSFAILAIKSGEEKIIGIRKDSPLVIGVGKKECFAASDIYALLPFTKNFIFLQNYDFFELKKGKFKIENLKLGKVKRPVEVINIRYKEKKKTFHHFMIKEILEDANVFESAFNQNIERLVKALLSYKKIFFVAAGSSYHASLAFHKLLLKASVNSFPIVASEFEYYKELVDKDSLVIAISQSGETADVLEAVREAKEKKAKVFSIINVYGSSLMRESDDYVLMNAGFEIGVAATKTYIAQLAIALKVYSIVKKKKINVEEVKAKILDLVSRNRREFTEKVAEYLKNKHHIFLIGKDLHYVTALEGALKLKEIPYIHAEAFPGGELKHGTLALIENGTPCIVFMDEEKKVLPNAEEMKARGGFIIGISSTNEKVFDLWIKVPSDDETSLVYQIIPMQLLAYVLAKRKGLNPDKPKNLAKVVTVK